MPSEMKRLRQGDRRDAHALWLSPDPCAAQTRGLECQSEADLSPLPGVGPPAPQQDAQAPGQCEASLRSSNRQHDSPLAALCIGIYQVLSALYRTNQRVS